MRRSIIVAAILALSGCSVVATHEEYTAYRAVRLASGDEARLVAMAEYAEHYPTGYWSAEIRTERESREQGVWLSGNSTREGLELYLRTYPDGTYAEQAHARLAAVSAVTEHREVEQTHVEEVTQAHAQATAEERRQWVSRAATFWIRTLMGIRNYGQPISAVARANPEFSTAFGQEPAPVCGPAQCLKHYHSHYAIPVPGATRIERDMHMFLRLRMDTRGRVERVEVLMPNKGFSRWYEMENRTLVTDEDPEQRQQAIEWALGRLEPIIAEMGAGGHAIDVIPEPIVPISASDSAASEVAADAETEVPQDQAVAEQTAPETGAAAEPPADDSLEALLAAAAGVDTTQTPEVTEEVPSDDSAMTMVLPIGLRALQLRNVRVVVFAAGEEDYGDGYDGFYIELARD
jgi:hypothetical protein